MRCYLSVLKHHLLPMGEVIVHHMSTHVDPPHSALPSIIVISAVCCTTASTRSLQKCLVRHPGCLIDQDVQSLLKDACFGKLYLVYENLLLLRLCKSFTTGLAQEEIIFCSSFGDVTIGIRHIGSKPSIFCCIACWQLSTSPWMT